MAVFDWMRYADWLNCGQPTAPVFWYAGIFIFSMLMICAYTAYLQILCLRFVAKYPVITAASMRDLRHTLNGGRGFYIMSLFFVALPIFTGTMLVVAYGIYTSAVLWIPVLMWIVTIGGFFRFGLVQMKTLCALPCAGLEVYKFSRKLFRSGGMIFHFPSFSDDSVLIDPKRQSSEYSQIGKWRFHRIVTLEYFALFIYSVVVLLEIVMVYDISCSSGSSGQRHYFYQDGTLRRDTYSEIFPAGNYGYSNVVFMPDGRIKSVSKHHGVFLECAVCEDRKYRVVEVKIIGNRHRYYSRKDGALLLHMDANGNRIYQNPRLKAEYPWMTE